MTAVLKYDAACRAVAEAKGFDEVREWEDKAAAVREYSRRAKNRSLELDALEIRERARLRRGQLLLELKEMGQLAEGRREKTVTDEGPFRLTLDDLHVSKNESARDQKLAQMGTDSFERLVARCRSYMEEHPEKHSFASIPTGPVNGARSIMGSRQEPDDSLDFFPTPPFATRALVEHVLPVLGISEIKTVWEPACGEGHIAGVLQEYGAQVYATDIFDYGTQYQGRLCNFLNPEDYAPSVKHGRHDWIITNPPFGDKAIEFVLRGLEMARIGVAMFFRSQWAVEGKERYERLFRDRPPTLCAFFVERVNLRKGHWDAKGSTATAYCWLVWLRGPENPRAPFWIPPGRKKALSRPDDHERFSPSIIDEPPHDAVTGEVIDSETEAPPSLVEPAESVPSSPEAVGSPNQTESRSWQFEKEAAADLELPSFCSGKDSA